MRAMLRKVVYHAIGLSIAVVCSIPMFLLLLGLIGSPYRG